MVLTTSLQINAQTLIAMCGFVSTNQIHNIHLLIAQIRLKEIITNLFNKVDGTQAVVHATVFSEGHI